MRFLSFANALAAPACLAICAQAAAATMPVFDGDADGVNDQRDACLYSPRGIVVGPDGCSTPGDEDEDSIADALDACPLSPAGSITDAQGCALDEDVDGTADGVDRCPGTRQGSTVNAQGCGPGQTASASAPRRAAYVAAPAILIPPPAPEPLPVPALPVVVSPPLPAPAPAPAPVPAAPAVVVIAPLPAVPVPAAPVAAPLVIQAIKPPLRTEPVLTVYFHGGDAELSGRAERAIAKKVDALRNELEQNALATLILSGHADTKFDGSSAPRLAAQRVAMVRQALLEAGVHAHRLSIRVAGVTEPRFERDELENNCRVEVVMLTRPAGIPIAAPVRAVPPAAPAVPVAVVAAPLPQPPAIAVAQTVSFAPNSARLDERAVAALNLFVVNLGDGLRKNPQVRVSISGLIDASEAGPSSLRLAQSRAASVRSQLKSLGLPVERLDIAADTASTAGDGSGRRVDLRVLSR